MENLQKIYDLKFYDERNFKKLEEEFKVLNDAILLSFLNEKYSNLSNFEEIKNFFNFLEFILKNKNDLVQKDALSKYFLKITLQQIKTSNLTKKTSLLETIRKIFTIYLKDKNEKSVFKKTLEIMLLKLDTKTFGILCKILVLTKSQNFAKIVKKRIESNLKKFEKSPFIMSPYSLILLEEKFFSEKIISFLNKLIKKSMSNYPKIVKAVSDLNLVNFENYPILKQFDNIIEIQLADAMTKGEIPSKQAFFILGKILKNRANYENLEKISKVFMNLTKKLWNNKKVDMCFSFCELISLSCVRGYEKNLKNTFKQFFDSLKIINERPAKNILNDFLKNKSIMENLESLNYLLSKEIKDRNIGFYYNLLLNISKSENEEIKNLYNQKIKEEMNIDLKAGKNFTNKTYRDFIWGVGFSLKNKLDLDLKLVTKNFLKKDNIWFNKNLLNFISGEESYMFLEILNTISEELENTLKNSDLTAVGILLFNLIRKIEKSNFRRISLNRYLCNLLINGIYAYQKNLEKLDDESPNEITSYIFKFLFSQKNLSISGEENLKKFAIILSYMPLYTKLNLKFYKIYMRNDIVEKFNKLENFNYLDFVLDKNHLSAFDDRIYDQSVDYLANMMYFFPNTLEKISYFFHPNIISKLTRMKKITNTLNNLKNKETIIWKKSELDALELYGYITKSFMKSYLSNLAKEEEKEENGIIINSLENYKSLQETEDEKYEELENLNEKEIITENYRNILCKIQLIFTKFANKFQKHLKKEHLAQLGLINTTLHKSVKKANYLSDIIQIAYEKVFNVYLCSQNENLSKLSNVYCFVINENNEERVLTVIEEFIEKLENGQILDSKLFIVFFDILEYIVKFKFDVEYKKKILGYLIASVEENPQFKKKLFVFICKNINDLYFTELFKFIEDVMVDLSKDNGDVLDIALLDLLIYEDFAIKVFLEKIKIVLESGEIENQVVLPYQRLKLLTMTESQNEKISEMAKDLIKTQKCILFDVKCLRELSFEEMIIDLPFDLHSIVRIVMKNLYISLNEEEKKYYLEKFISEFTKLLEKKFEESEKETFSERLEIFPNILKDISEIIDDQFVPKIFDCLILIEKKGLGKLTQISFDFGVELINIKKNLIEKLTNIFQTYIKSEEGLIGPIIFIGESAKIDNKLIDKFKNLENNLLNLLNHKNIDFHKNLSKFLRNLISFFKKPEEILNKLIDQTIEMKDPLQIRINCYFIAGMIKGIGVKCLIKNKIFEKIQLFITNSKKRDLKDIYIGKRYFSVYLLDALWFCLRKVLEPLINQTISILMNFLGDNLEEIRVFTKKSLDKIMKEVSSYSIKQIIPILLEGTEDKNWRKKLNSILGLGAVAYCGIKQLSENLPIIVPKLTNKINDTNENIKEAAVKSLSLILSTIKNPEISQIRDTIILSLSNPFTNNQKSLEALLSIRFMHYIDGPALSLIMPIIIYGLKSSPKSESKEKAAKVVANILSLINNDEDLWPHIENLIDALQFTLKDLSPEVRGVTSKAFKSISLKFGSLSNFMLNKLKATLVHKDTISIEKAGNAQAFAEILSILDEDSFLYIFKSLLKLTTDKREHVRESFLSVFVYLPIIQGQKYQKYVIETMNAVIQSINHDRERIRNLGIKCMKILIQSFFKENREILVKVLYEGSIDEDPVKRNSSLILIGDVIEIIFKTNDIDKNEIYKNYPKVFSIIYIMKNDQNPEVKITAVNIFKTFIDNTPKCLKMIYLNLVECFIDMYIRRSEHYDEMADNGLKEFSLKYGDVYITGVLEFLNKLKEKEGCNILSLAIFLKKFIRFYNRNYFIADRINKLSVFLKEFFANEDDETWREAVKGVRYLCEMTGSIDFVKEMIEPLIVNVDELEKAEIEKAKLENEEEEENEEEDEEEDEEEEESTCKDKLIEIVCELLLSENPKISNLANKYIFQNAFKEWQVTVIVVNIRIYGSLLYDMKDLKTGLNKFLDFFEKQEDLEYQQLFLYATTQLCLNIDPKKLQFFINDVVEKIEDYNKNKKFRMLFFLFQILKQYYEEATLNQIYATFKIGLTFLTLLDYNGEGKELIFEDTSNLIWKILKNIQVEKSGEYLGLVSDALKKKVQDSGKALEGFKTTKVFQSILNLISKVLQTNLSYECVHAIDLLDYLFKILENNLLEAQKAYIYGFLLKSLSYQHTENYILKVIRFFNVLLDKKIYPDDSGEYISIYLIYTCNNLAKGNVTYLPISEFTHRLIEETQGEFHFLKKWKFKILSDPIYVEENLIRFIEMRPGKSADYLKFIETIN